MLFHGEALHNFDLLSNNPESTETLSEHHYIKGLAFYFSTVNFLLKKAHDALSNEKPRNLKNMLCDAPDWSEWIFISPPGRP